MFVVTLIAVILMSLETIGELVGEHGNFFSFLTDLFVTILLCVFLKGVA
jgi:hypothetical protein